MTRLLSMYTFNMNSMLLSKIGDVVWKAYDMVVSADEGFSWWN